MQIAIMYNLRNGKGSFKGIIGECMLKLTDKDMVVTKFFNKNKYILIFGKYFSKEQLDFIKLNWFSIDAIKIHFEGGKKLCLYEIKTKNRYDNPKPFWLTKFTQETNEMYRKALSFGFEVKVATVWLLDNWDYEIELEDFQSAKYCIDKPKPYDLSARGRSV